MTSGHGEKLTRKQEQAIAAFLAEPTLTAAARCGVGEKTMWRWLQLPGFDVAYRTARRALVDTVVASLQQGATEAVSCLRRNLACGQPGVEVRAAAVILEQVLGALDRLELEERLRRLEALPEATGEPSRGRHWVREAPGVLQSMPALRRSDRKSTRLNSSHM